MRKVLFGVTLFTLVLAVGVSRASAQHEGHEQPAQHEGHGEPAKPAADAAKDKAAPTAEKKDPNRPKPENQPGAVMNAEELAASHAEHHEMITFEGGGVLPEGWKSRFDLPNMKLEHVRFLSKGTGYHVTSGPPGIYYNATMTASGEYTVKGTFTQLAEGEHREGYGPFIGGTDLDGAGQRYTYFLVRKDGKYLIKQRDGINTKGVMDWTAHAAIKPFDADKKMTNDLAIVVGPSEVQFLINGTEVARRPRAEVDTNGIVGLRVNHNLDLDVAGLTIEPK
jgi:hypothetical protein